MHQMLFSQSYQKYSNVACPMEGTLGVIDGTLKVFDPNKIYLQGQCQCQCQSRFLRGSNTKTITESTKACTV